MNNNFDKILDVVIDDLGHHCEREGRIMLYDVPNNPDTLNKIKQKINKITTNYKFIVLHPDRDITNINLLDIDL